MKIYCGDYEVLDSGTLSIPDLSDVKFVLSQEPLMEIVARVLVSGETPKISLEAIGESTLAIIFHKPEGLGYGPAAPIKVGHLNGRALYVSFRVSMRGNNSSYGLEYTFYLKEAV